MSIPRLSVLMTTYNGSRFLSEAVESVLSQTFVDFEFIIVDDGSSDSSASIIRSFATRDSRVRGIFLPKNVGIPRAANIGLRAVRAPLVARMDSDDLCAPSRFAKQVAYMDKCPDIHMLGSFYRDIDELGNATSNRVSPRLAITIPIVKGRHRIMALTYKWQYVLLHASNISRTASLRAVGGYREIFPFSEDDDIYLRLLDRYGAVLENLPQRLYFYRRYGSSTTHAKSEQKVLLVQFLLKYSMNCRSLGLRDPLDVAQALSLSLLPVSIEKRKELKQLFFLLTVVNMPSGKVKGIRWENRIRSEVSCFPVNSEERKFFEERFFLLLTPDIPLYKETGINFFNNFDVALPNKDSYLSRINRCNMYICVARGCLRYGEWKFFLCYLLRSFGVHFIFTSYFFCTRALAHLRK